MTITSELISSGNSRHDQLLLIGSCPLDTSELVMRHFGAKLGQYLHALPDGEIGERQFWVIRQHFRVLHGHSDIVTLQRPLRDGDIERLIPHSRHDRWLFRVRDGVEHVRFAEPGWRLGYAQDAINSYCVFKLLKEQGAIPQHLRFQVSIPTPNSVISLENWPRPEDLPRVRPGYESAVETEIATICNHIPHDQLAIQFDSVWELGEVYGYFDGVAPCDAVNRNIEQIRKVASAIPREVHLGFHLCFGTFGGWPRIQSNDLQPAIDIANGFIAAAERQVDWIHIPLAELLNEAYYAPLENLDLRGARLYLGLIHHMNSFEKRLSLARRYSKSFGLAAYCGLGRVPPDELPEAIREHEEAIRIAIQ